MGKLRPRLWDSFTDRRAFPASYTAGPSHTRLAILSSLHQWVASRFQPALLRPQSFPHFSSTSVLAAATAWPRNLCHLFLKSEDLLGWPTSEESSRRGASRARRPSHLFRARDSRHAMIGCCGTGHCCSRGPVSRPRMGMRTCRTVSCPRRLLRRRSGLRQHSAAAER